MQVCVSKGTTLVERKGVFFPNLALAGGEAQSYKGHSLQEKSPAFSYQEFFVWFSELFSEQKLRQEQGFWKPSYKN